MISNPLVITKHLFQISLTQSFGLPVTVDIGERDKDPQVIMVEQTTIDQWAEDYPMNTTTVVPPIWVAVKVTLAPNVVDDVQNLTESYEDVFSKIKGKIKMGRFLNESSF